MKFILSNYSRFQNPWLGGYRPQIPFSLSSVLNRICWTPTPTKIPGYATVKHNNMHLAVGFTLPETPCILNVEFNSWMLST